MALPGIEFLRKLFVTGYAPQPQWQAFLSRAQSQENPSVNVSVAVLDAAECVSVFGVHLARRGLQPVFLRIANRGDVPLRLDWLSIDPNYFTPLEAAGVNHYSLLRWIPVFGILGWFLLPLAVLLLPFKWISMHRANRWMNEVFQSQAFPLRPIGPGETAQGFVFTKLDLGTKIVHIHLQRIEQSEQAAAQHKDDSPIDFTFSIPVPGIRVDFTRRDFATLLPADSIESVQEMPALIEKLRAMPATTTNEKDTGKGDPVNLVVIGKFETLLSVFSGRWDETETITFGTAWKTFRAFLLGSQYRYSPVSPLYLFARSQDIALQRSRRKINERLHLRLWLTPIQLRDQPVWIGQVSRDIGVRFTTKTWNLTTHRIDPEVDEARDYVVQDVLEVQQLKAVHYIEGVGKSDPSAPRRNLTGDPYFTDGKRAVLQISAEKTTPTFVDWS
jgi:LssY C-terminus